MRNQDVASDEVFDLIIHGRDREAAELATYSATTRRARGAGQGDDMNVLTQFDQLGPTLGSVIGGIRPDQLDNPTPCDDFTVRGVLEHMIGGATTFAAAFRGEEATVPDTTDVLAAFGPALGGLAAAVAAPGAFDRSIATPGGDLPGEDFARFVVLDGLVHGWDLATASGQTYEPSAELVAAVSEFAQAAVPPMRDGESFADATEPPADASPIERLVAFTGRSVPPSLQ